MNKNKAFELLSTSREKIDQIDNQIIDLIIERTSLAKDISTAKKVLNTDIENTEREDYIQRKIKKLAKDNDIDEISLLEIMDILMKLNKSEQERILKR
ncbi:MAG TPA: chorismate mutase [Methanobacterium sp.]|nr:MAG: chorismate mutase [Methanobacterium sp.]HOI71369.1 chorismate mutase [Methanobacterium sp.]HPX77983.1 chorismate mutase [Methanobacterium sp.]